MNSVKNTKFHIEVIQEIEKHIFDKVILSGDFLKKALSMTAELKNKYVYRRSSKIL